MTNKEINQLRVRINRVRKTADGTRQACEQIMGDCDDLSEMLNNMVSENLWGSKATAADRVDERPRSARKSAPRPSRGMTEDDVLALLTRVFGKDITA